jgi:hypothetical protein
VDVVVHKEKAQTMEINTNHDNRMPMAAGPNHRER